MTLEELQRSDVVKQWVATLLKHKTFSDILDAVQRQAMPSKKTCAVPLTPGVHPDNTLAHQTHYNAGWSDCITFIRSIPTGEPLQGPPQEEEEFGYLPDVVEIDRQIELTKNASPTKP